MRPFNIFGKFIDGTGRGVLIGQEVRYEKSSIVHGWLEEVVHLRLAAGIYAEDKGSQG